MGKIAGGSEYEKFKEGKFLSRTQAVKANCYMCNGLEESNVDCQGYSCPLYAWSPSKKRDKRRFKTQPEALQA